jgi:asparagine synthase (glutamine-hydrolysing)
MTMAASIEARMPFVDYELAAFLSSLPDSFRIRDRRQKWLLHEAMREVLPRAVMSRHNTGFRVPVGTWFSTTLKDYVYENLLGSSSRTRDFYRRNALQRIVDDHMSGRAEHEELIWSLLSFEIFQREYGVSC